MKFRFLQFLKRITGLGKANNSPVSLWKKSGNIEVAEEADITHANISLIGTKKGHLNLKIGRDSILQCKILIYSADALVEIGERVFIGPDTTIFCNKNIVIQDDVMISWGCTVIDTNAHSLNSKNRLNDVLDWKAGPEKKDWSVVQSRSVVIKNKSWVGFNSIIMKGVVVEEGTVVAAGSVVTKDTGRYSVVGGNPAKYIKDID